MLWLIGAFVPWLAFWLLQGTGHPVAASFSAFAIAASLVVIHRSSARLFGIATLVLFAAQLLVGALADSTPFAARAPAVPALAMAAVCEGSLLLGIPFTLQYTRHDWPRSFWDNEVLARTNEIVSRVWVGLFLLIGLLSLPVSAESSRWMTVFVPLALAAAGGGFSIAFAQWYPLRASARHLSFREPYRWPDPVFVPPLRPERALPPLRPGRTLPPLCPERALPPLCPERALPPLRPGRALPPPAADCEPSSDVIVIGAGLAGLTAAARLARRGLRVSVFEQGGSPGGFCCSWERNLCAPSGGDRQRFVFDAGVYDISGLGPGGTIRRVLGDLDIQDRVAWLRMTHEYVLSDGLRVSVPHETAALVARLQLHFPAERQGIAALFDDIQKFNRELFSDVDRTGGVVKYPELPSEYVQYPKTHPHAFYWMDRPFSDLLDRHVRDRRLRRILTIVTSYLTDDPTTLRVLDVAPLYQYYFDGAYYPRGGSRSLPDALVESIRAYQGQLRYRTPVSRILVEGGRAVGIETADGTTCRAQAIISNADVWNTYTRLLPPSSVPLDLMSQVRTLRPSTSGFMVFLGLDFVPNTTPITAFAYDDTVLWIAITSLVDPDLAPPGCANATLVGLLPQPEAAHWDRRAPGYRQRKREHGDRLVTLAERVMPGLRDHIVFRQEASPATFARFAMAKGGALYGMATGQKRLPMRSPIERLYLAGACVFPGAGVEAVMTSGATVADWVYRGV